MSAPQARGDASANPYAWAWGLERSRRHAAGSWAEKLAPWGPLAAALLSLPLWGASLHDYLGRADGPRNALFLAMVSRMALVLAGALCLSTYSALIRGPERGVLSLHPLRPNAWWSAKMLDLFMGRLSWLGVTLVLMAPLHVAPVLAGAAAGVLSGAWLVGIGVGAAVNLAAPLAARTPALQGTLDAIRGMNPREHAALLYAPGFALGLAGLAVILSVQGAGAWISGREGAWLLVVPHVVGVAALVGSRPLASAVDRLPTLLGEIEAAWAPYADPEESRRVYLEWMAERAPAVLGREMLKDLRHGWRRLRTGISGAWLLGVLTAWAFAAGEPTIGAQLGAVALAITGGLAVLLAVRDPVWLDEAVPVARRVRTLARAVVVLGWGGPVVAAGLFDGAGTCLIFAFLALGLGGVGASTGLWLRGRAWPVYTAVALLAVAVVVGLGPGVEVVR